MVKTAHQPAICLSRFRWKVIEARKDCFCLPLRCKEHSGAAVAVASSGVAAASHHQTVLVMSCPCLISPLSWLILPSHGDHGNAMVKTRMGLASLRAKAGGVKGDGQQLQRTFFRKAKQLDSLKSDQVGQVQCHRKYYSIYVQQMDNSHELWHDFDQLTTLSIAVGHTRDFGRIIADNGILLLGGEVHCISSAPQWPAMARR